MKTSTTILVISIIAGVLFALSFLSIDERMRIKPFNLVTETLSPFNDMNVRVTCYRATVQECGNDLGICYDGTIVEPGIVALSPDLFYYTSLKMGDTIIISGTPMDGIYVVHDKTHKSITNTVDIYITDKQKGFSERGMITWK